MGCCGGGDGGAAAQRAEEEARQARIREGIGAVNTQFEGFNDAFYDKRKEAYSAFALPQLGQQFQDTSRQLSYRNANAGLLDSSGARFLNDSLQREMTKQRQGIADMGQQQANQLRRDVEGERSNLILQTQASADPSLAAQQAMQQAGSLQLPSTFAPVSNFLSGWAQNYLTNQVAQAYQGGGSNRQNSGSAFFSAPTTVRVN